MGYATLQDLANRLGPAAYLQLTDDEATGEPNEARAQEALDAAEAEVNSRLASRFAVPLEVAAEPQAAAMLRAVALDLAEYRLHARRPPVPDAVEAKALQTLQWLQDVAEGRAQMPLLREVPANESRGTIAEADGPQRVFRLVDVR
jgi:phage gp36-like protein